MLGTALGKASARSVTSVWGSYFTGFLLLLLARTRPLAKVLWTVWLIRVPSQNEEKQTLLGSSLILVAALASVATPWRVHAVSKACTRLMLDLALCLRAV